MKPIHGMNISIDAVQILTDVPEWMFIQQIQQAMAQDEHSQQLNCFITAVGQKVRTSCTRTLDHTGHSGMT